MVPFKTWEELAAARADFEQRTVDFRAPGHTPPSNMSIIQLIHRCAGVAVAAVGCTWSAGCTAGGTVWRMGARFGAGSGAGTSSDPAAAASFRPSTYSSSPPGGSSSTPR